MQVAFVYNTDHSSVYCLFGNKHLRTSYRKNNLWRPDMFWDGESSDLKRGCWNRLFHNWIQLVGSIRLWQHQRSGMTDRVWTDDITGPKWPSLNWWHHRSKMTEFELMTSPVRNDRVWTDDITGPKWPSLNWWHHRSEMTEFELYDITPKWPLFYQLTYNHKAVALLTNMIHCIRIWLLMNLNDSEQFLLNNIYSKQFHSKQFWTIHLLNNWILNNFFLNNILDNNLWTLPNNFLLKQFILNKFINNFSEQFFSEQYSFLNNLFWTILFWIILTLSPLSFGFLDRCRLLDALVERHSTVVNIWNNPFVRSFVCLFVCTFVRLLIRLIVRSFIRSLILNLYIYNYLL